MLTGTCDVCHEAAPFADHLAGTAVRCEKCGMLLGVVGLIAWGALFLWLFQG